MQVQIVRDEADGLALGQFFDYRVAAGVDAHLAGIGEARAFIAIFNSHLGQIGCNIPICDDRSGRLDAIRVGCREGPHLVNSRRRETA